MSKSIFKAFIGAISLTMVLLSPAFAQDAIAPPFCFQEEDGDPSTCYPVPIKVTNGTLTVNADGSISISIAGGAEVNNLETITTDIGDDEVPIGTAANTAIYKALPDCDTAATSKLLYDTTTNTFSCGTDQDSGGATAWDDIGDPDNNGLTTIDFDNASENTVLTNVYDAAGSFFKIDNSDADLANEVTLLGLEFTDDASTNGIFIKATDNNGDTVWQLGADGKMTIGPGVGDYILPTVRGTADQILADSGAGAGAIQFRDLADIETDPNVDTPDEIEAILTNDNMDFGTGIVTADGLTINGNADIEGYASIGNGSALDPSYSLIIDRDFTDNGNENVSQLVIGGLINKTTFAPGLAISYAHLAPTTYGPSSGITLDAISPPVTTTLYLEEPNITETGGGAALIASTLYIKNAPTEGTSNFALRVDDGDVQFDGNMESATITEGGIGVPNLQEIDTFSELDAIVADKALVNKADGAVWLGVHDFGGATSLEIPNSATDSALGSAGVMHLNTLDEQISFHSGADGEISGEASLSLLWHWSAAFDPSAWYDQESTYRAVPVMYVGDDAPEGVTITEWRVNYVGGDPTTELDMDLVCDTTPDFNTAAGATVMDAMDTTAGASTADTGFDSATCANGARMYLHFGADPTDANVIIAVDIWGYREED